MESNFSFVLENSLLQSKLFSYLDTFNLREARFVCSKWAEAGKNILTKRSIYFVLNSSIWANRKSVREFNKVKLNWIQDCLNEESSFWLLQNVEIPFSEFLECKEIRAFFEKHGHLIKNLRLVKYEAFFADNLFKISPDCSSPLQLIHLILTSWCRNLISLTIKEKLRKWSRLDTLEYQFPQFELPQPVFEATLKLESLTIELQVLDTFLSRNIPISYFQEIFTSSPNLKRVRAIWAWPTTIFDVHKPDELLFPEGLDYELHNLETLELPYLDKDISFLERITSEKFPKLKILDIGFQKIGAVEDFEVLPIHPGFNKVTLRTSLIEIESNFELYFKKMPKVSEINFVEGFKTVDLPSIKKSSYLGLSDTCGNIRKLEMDTRNVVNIISMVHLLGNMCPNLELCKMKRIAGERGEEEVKIKAISDEIINVLKNLRQFELEYFGPLWVDGEWEELKGHLNSKLDEQRGRDVRFYFGSEDYLKTRTRFYCPNMDLS